MINGKYVYKLAHRMAWELTYGEIPAGLVVMHSCDVRHCVNPGHLQLGTRKDNNQDRVMKGRTGIRSKPIACYRGHLYTPKNIAIHKSGWSCRTCKREYDTMRRRQKGYRLRIRKDATAPNQLTLI
jgi:hypothetical protein